MFCRASLEYLAASTKFLIRPESDENPSLGEEVSMPTTLPEIFVCVLPLAKPDLEAMKEFCSVLLLFLLEVCTMTSIVCNDNAKTGTQSKLLGAQFSGLPSSGLYVGQKRYLFYVESDRVTLKAFLLEYGS